MTKRRCWHPDSRKPLVVLLAVVATATWSTSAVAGASVHDIDSRPPFVAARISDAGPAALISNIDQQDTDGFLLFSGGSVFQGFSTGANPGGYSLSQVSVIPQERTPDPEEVTEMSDSRTNLRLQIADSSTHSGPEFEATRPRVEIWSQKGRNITMPDELLYALITPQSVPLGEAVAFTAPPGTTLDADTSYYVRIIDVIQLGWDLDRDIDSDAADGWSLDDGLMYQTEGASAWGNYAVNAIVAIRGTALSAQAP